MAGGHIMQSLRVSVGGSLRCKAPSFGRRAGEAGSGGWKRTRNEPEARQQKHNWFLQQSLRSGPFSQEV